MNEGVQPLGILLNDPDQVCGLTANIPKFHDITLLYVLWLPKFLQAELYHFQYTQRDVKLGVLVINSTCKDKRNSGNHDIICD